MASAATHVALLRGINVGKSGRVKMADLTKELAHDGIVVTATVVQSGNLVVKGWTSGASSLALTIEKSISASFGFDTKCLVRTHAQLDRILAANPLEKIAVDPSRYVVHFCEPAMTAAVWAELVPEIVEPKFVAMSGGCVYQWCPAGISNAQLISPLIERRTRSAVTARNWRTLTTLSEAC